MVGVEGQPEAVFAVASTLRHHLTINLRRFLKDQPGNATKAAPCDGHAGELLTKTQDLLGYYWFRQILTPVIILLCFCEVGINISQAKGK